MLLLCPLAPLPAAATGDGAPSGRQLASAQVTAQASRLRALRLAATRRRLTVRIAEVDDRARYWLRLMHRPVPPPVHLARLPLAELRHAAEWRLHRAALLARQARNPPHLSGWRCIQEHETGAPFPGWHTDSGNGYFGGLQFDLGFQRTYGGWLYRSKGTAEHWTPLEQIWTAEYALAEGRGFAPWPNSARACGLL